MCFNLWVVKDVLNWRVSENKSFCLVDVEAQVKWKESPRKLAQVVLAENGDRGEAGEKCEWTECRSAISFTSQK